MKSSVDTNLSKGAENLTTLVSVSLLLLIAGVAVALAVAGRNESTRLRENMELTVIMADSATDAQASALASMLGAKPYVAKAEAISRARALRNWNDATGDDLEALYGVNPLSPEVTVRLHANYTSPEQMQILARGLESQPGVEGVALPQTQFVEGMNRTLRQVIWFMALLCVGLVVISLVLINNMVHLGIYSQRFAIRTMQLVGATDAFVRRPFLLRHALNGALAGLIASALLASALTAARPLLGFDIYSLLPWGSMALLAAGLAAFGALMCTAAAWYATYRHLHSATNDLFA